MKIIGTGSAVPKKVVTNDMLADFLDTTDEWITSRTGIHNRHLLTEENLLDLAIEAAKNAIASSGVAPKDIDLIICSNVANNYITPSMSTMVEGEIGCECPCVDMNVACAGFIYALDYAEAYFVARGARNILVLCAEEPTRFLNWKQRENSVLFGDGAGAVVLTGQPLACCLQQGGHHLSQTHGAHPIRGRGRQHRRAALHERSRSVPHGRQIVAARPAVCA